MQECPLYCCTPCVRQSGHHLFLILNYVPGNPQGKSSWGTILSRKPAVKDRVKYSPEPVTLAWMLKSSKTSNPGVPQHQLLDQLCQFRQGDSSKVGNKPTESLVYSDCPMPGTQTLDQPPKLDRNSYTFKNLGRIVWNLPARSPLWRM